MSLVKKIHLRKMKINSGSGDAPVNKETIACETKSQTQNLRSLNEGVWKLNTSNDVLVRVKKKNVNSSRVRMYLRPMSVRRKNRSFVFLKSSSNNTETLPNILINHSDSTPKYILSKKSMTQPEEISKQRPDSETNKIFSSDIKIAHSETLQRIEVLNRNIKRLIHKTNKELMSYKEKFQKERLADPDGRGYKTKESFRSAVQELQDVVSKINCTGSYLKTYSEPNVPDYENLSCDTSISGTPSSSKRHFDVKLYNFYLPKQVLSAESAQINCPPFSLLLDHTVAVIWRMFLLKRKHKDEITPTHFNWALYYLDLFQSQRTVRSLSISYCTRKLYEETQKIQNVQTNDLKSHLADFTRNISPSENGSMKCIKKNSVEFEKFTYLQNYRKLQPLGRYVIQLLLNESTIDDTNLTTNEKYDVEAILNEFQEGNKIDPAKVIPVDVKINDIPTKMETIPGSGDGKPLTNNCPEPIKKHIEVLYKPKMKPCTSLTILRKCLRSRTATTNRRKDLNKEITRKQKTFKEIKSEINWCSKRTEDEKVDLKMQLVAIGNDVNQVLADFTSKRKTVLKSSKKKQIVPNKGKKVQKEDLKKILTHVNHMNDIFKGVIQQIHEEKRKILTALQNNTSKDSVEVKMSEYLTTWNLRRALNDKFDVKIKSSYEKLLGVRNSLNCLL